jgi:anti-sigma regulatory factor (Ser/Thr protein kinase)
VEALLRPALAFTVADPSQISATRLALQRLARDLEFDETRSGRLSIVATEAVTNLVRHGGGGTLTARTLARNGALGVEMLAIDAGPGMRDFAHSARDGVSTTSTPGTGLGAIGRLADEFDVDTAEGKGTILRMVVWNKAPSRDDDPYEVGAVLVPKEGETACGDAWAFEPHADGCTFVVVDGLGHGAEASRAAAGAIEVLRRNAHRGALELLDLAHGRLRATRGAAVAFIRHDRRRGEVAFAGVGNIAACILDGQSRRAMVSHNGIVGHNVHKSQEYVYPWPAGAMLIAHSDGLETHWEPSAFPGLASRHPSLAAAALFRRHTRTRDDVVVMAARQR